MQDVQSDTHPDGSERSAASPPITVNAIARTDGTLVVQYTQPTTGETVKVTFSPSGQYSLLRLRERVWRELSLTFSTGRRSHGPSLTIRSAKSQPDGSVEAKLTAIARRGQRMERTLHLDESGGWRSSFAASRPDGQVISGDARSDGGADGRIVRQRQKIDARGQTAWVVDTETRTVQTQTNQQASLRRAGAAVPSLFSTSKTTYASGALGTTSVLATVEQGGVSPPPAGNIHWSSTTSKPGSTTTHQGVIDANLTWEMVVRETRYDDGRVTVTTEKTDIIQDESSLLIPKHIELSGETRYPNGSKVTWRETSDWGPWQQRPDIDPAGETGKSMHTDTWERTTVGRDGAVTHERGAETISDAGTSKTSSVHRPDGTTVVTTTTKDNDGHGTRHTTVVDKRGETVSDKTETVGPGDDSSDDDSSGNSANNGSDGGDDGSDDGAPLGEEGGPTGAGWHGGNDGPLGLLPGHASSAYGSAIIIDDPLANPEHDQYRSVPAHILARLTYDALVNPGVAYSGSASRGVAATGGGNERGGGTSLSGLRVASGTTMFLGAVPIPPEEEMQWDNPEIHFAFLAETVAALKQGGGIDSAALATAETAIQDLSALSATFGAKRVG